MKVAIVGSRNLVDVEIEKYLPKNITEIITGGASGIDTLAENYADLHEIPKTIIKPNYKKYGRKAPLIRNKTIVELADKVIAIWDGKSTGTLFTINYAKRLGKDVEVHYVTDFFNI